MYKHTFKVVQNGVPVTEAKKVMVLVHGRGGSAEGILPLAQQFAFKPDLAIAPAAVHNSWYPYSFLAPRNENQPALASGLENLETIVSDLHNQGIQGENICLFGFSQGACLVLEYLARFGGQNETGRSQLGAVIAFTGGLIGSQVETTEYQANLQGTSVWISGGDQDHHVPLERMEATASILKNLGARVNLEVYPGKPHSISYEEIEAANHWLQET